MDLGAPNGPRGLPGMVPLLLMLGAMITPAPALALTGPTGPPPLHQIRFRSLTAVQYNPLGAQTDFFLGYRLRLFSNSALALQQNFFGAAAIVRINPAFTRLGACVELQPLTVLTLRVMFEERLYFGSFDMMQSFAGPLEEYDEDTLKARGEAGLSNATTGHQLTLQATLRAKVGPLVILDDLNMIYFHMDARPGDKVFYVNLLDTVAPTPGWVLVNNAHLLVLTKYRFIFGLRYTLVHALYPDEWLAGAEDPNTPNHRVGPMLAYTFASTKSWFQQPSLILILNWWLGSRYRSGQKVHQGVPYGVLALQFTGELWRK